MKIARFMGKFAMGFIVCFMMFLWGMGYKEIHPDKTVASMIPHFIQQVKNVQQQIKNINIKEIKKWKDGK